MVKPDPGAVVRLRVGRLACLLRESRGPLSRRARPGLRPKAGLTAPPVGGSVVSDGAPA